MAEYIMIKNERVEVPVDFIEVGRDAVEAFHITVAAGKTIPTELLTASDAETAKQSQPDSVKAAAEVRAARLGRIAAWAQPIVDAAKKKAEKSSAIDRATDRGAVPQEK